MVRTILGLTALLASAAASAQEPAGTSAPAKVRLWQLDCGMLDENRERKFEWQRVATPTPCYLIGHNDRYMLWDTGVSARAMTANHPVIKLKRTITDQLKEIGVTPDQVAFVGLSHYHGDHTGQATQFPKATLLIGAGDYHALKSKNPPGGAAPTHIQPWIDGKSKVEPLVEDRDVFGDGTVRMLQTPGHTPGHTALLVKLASGPVILAGDLWFTNDDAIRGTMPDFNTSRAETIASRERIARMAESMEAVVIIQHDPAHAPRIPAFPKAAE
jgi:N-acyl homoserine lactone hydrolase